MAVACWLFQLALWTLMTWTRKMAQADMFTAMSDMETMWNAEKEAMDYLVQYLKEEYTRLNILKRMAHDHASYCEHRPSNITNSLKTTDAVDLFLQIKRLYWTKVLMKKNNAEKYLTRISQALSSRPDEEDSMGAALALFRLQDTYQLDTRELADGLVAGSVLSRPLTARDCFELGRVAYDLDQSDYYHTLLWMQEADRRLNSEKEKPSMDRAEILDYLSYAMFEQGNVERALHLTLQLKKLDPKRKLIDENIEYYENYLTGEGVDVNAMRLPPIRVKRDVSNKPTEFTQYERLCRGDMELDKTLQSKLTCYYKQNGQFLRLARIKVEVLHLKPKILLFKGVVSDAECDTIQRTAKPKFFRSQVLKCAGPDQASFEFSDKRTSKIAWLRDDESNVVHAITKRVEDMTDMTCATAEYMQVSNYGIGGQYESHFDFTEDDGAPAQRKMFNYIEAGNRIATVLFYFSQPLAGGGTVFPELNLKVDAFKRDAVFWYNLYPSGKGDKKMLHAGCPVLSGVKWAGNKWLHERGQELLRPCLLNRHDYE